MPKPRSGSREEASVAHTSSRSAVESHGAGAGGSLIGTAPRFGSEKAKAFLRASFLECFMRQGSRAVLSAAAERCGTDLLRYLSALAAAERCCWCGTDLLRCCWCGTVRAR
jgi:hypothetical protein